MIFLRVVYLGCLLLPLPLLALAWRRADKLPIEFSALTLSAVLLLSALVRSFKLSLLGNDYSERLFATITVNLLVAAILSLYLLVRRRWFAGIAASILALGWLLLAGANSVA